MKQIPPIKSVMTSFPHTVEADEPVARALELIREHGIRHLPVVDGGRLVGVIGERDAEAALSRPSAGLRVRDVERSTAYTVELHEPLDRVLEHMAHERIDCTLVVKDGRLAGIFTANDACRRFSELLHALFPRPGSDDAA